jgi:hypothetical protein
MALTGQWREIDYKKHSIASYPVAANTRIYKGALVVVRNTDGMAYNARTGNNSTDFFVGIAIETVDNTGGAPGARRIRVAKEGSGVYTGTGFTQTNVSAIAYATDENTVTTTAGSNVAVGHIVEVLSSTRARVRIDNLVR